MIWKKNLRFLAAFVLFCALARGAAVDDTVETCDGSAANSESNACSNSNQEESKTTTDVNKSKQWKWTPEAEHRCNIVRMTHDQVLNKFGPLGVPPLHPEPLVILGNAKRNAKFRELTSRENITRSLPTNMNVTLSSSNSFSAHRRTIPLTQYLTEIEQNNGITTPDQLSNETWYLFGETFTKDWKSLLKKYELPPCHTCQSDLVALSFGIGNRGSGVQWHVHGPGFSEALHGRKHWILYPHKPDYNPDYTSRHWMEYTYPNLSKKELPYECTLEPGDAVYFPDDWYHATINLDPYTAFVSTFTIEHL